MQQLWHLIQAIRGSLHAKTELIPSFYTLQRAFGIIDRQPLIDNGSEDGAVPAECAGTVAFKAVDFVYPQRPDVQIFSDFNLEVPAGTSVALVGPSGSGKSTIVGLALRFYDPLSGKVRRGAALGFGWHGKYI